MESASDQAGGLRSFHFRIVVRLIAPKILAGPCERGPDRRAGGALNVSLREMRRDIIREVLLIAWMVLSLDRKNFRGHVFL